MIAKLRAGNRVLLVDGITDPLELVLCPTCRDLPVAYGPGQPMAHIDRAARGNYRGVCTTCGGWGAVRP